MTILALALALPQTKAIQGSGGSPPPSTAGQPIGLLLLLTKAS